MLFEAALHTIGEADSFVGHANSPCSRQRAGRETIAARAGIANFAIGIDRALSFRDLLPRTRARINKAGIVKPVKSRFVRVLSFWTCLVDNWAVPVKSKRFEYPENVVSPMRGAARRVHVFHANQPLASISSRIEISGNGGHERAEVRRSGGRRGKAACIAGWYSADADNSSLAMRCG